MEACRICSFQGHSTEGCPNMQHIFVSKDCTTREFPTSYHMFEVAVVEIESSFFPFFNYIILAKLPRIKIKI